MLQAAMTYVKCIESLNTRLGKVVSYGVFVLIAIMVIDIVSMYIFNRSISWGIELAMFVVAGYIFLGGGYVLLCGGHVRMDILYLRWSPKKRAIVDIATFAILAVFLITFVLGGIYNVEYALRVGQCSPSRWSPILAPIKIIMVVGTALLFLQSIAFLIRDFVFLFRGKHLP